MTYLPPVSHKDGGYRCQHGKCQKQAVHAVEVDCDAGRDCEQAASEADDRYGAVDWTHIPEDPKADRLRCWLNQTDAATGAHRYIGSQRDDMQAQLDQLTADHTARIAAAQFEARERLTAALAGHKHPTFVCSDHAE